MTYRLDHGAIGNGRTIALIAPTSAIEWLCLPRFDSPSIFAALLDQRLGGHFQILARDRVIRGRTSYITNTNVLRTEFVDDVARWEVIDFAPRISEASGRFATPLEIVRIVRPLAGTPRLSIDFAPRPDYARSAGRTLVTQHGVEVLDAGAPLHLYTNVPGDHVVNRTEIALRAPIHFMLAYGHRAAAPTEAEIETPRTWDYRYCWLRDAAFVVEALRRLSHLNEGEKFIDFLRDVAESGPLQPLYGIAGERDLTEHVLEHLSGFANTGPVRIGNAAAEQQQNDLVGELVLCLQTMLLARGYNSTLGCFTQALDGEHGDAANLLFPSIGLVDARDPRFVSTLDDYAQRMTSGGLMQRYTNLDDFGVTTSAFTMCSFWWAEALALAGRLEEAIVVFDRVRAWV